MKVLPITTRLITFIFLLYVAPRTHCNANYIQCTVYIHCIKTPMAILHIKQNGNNSVIFHNIVENHLYTKCI